MTKLIQRIVYKNLQHAQTAQSKNAQSSEECIDHQGRTGHRNRSILREQPILLLKLFPPTNVNHVRSTDQSRLVTNTYRQVYRQGYLRICISPELA